MGQIYCIRNKINGKCYVGQTVNTFRQRYGYSGWHETTNNRYLKHSIASHGLDSFEVFIIHDNPEYTIDDLNKLEEMWAEKLSVYVPSGYNLRRCGDNRRAHPETRALVSKKIKCSNGLIYNSVSEAAKSLGLWTGHVSECAAGVRKYVKEYGFSYDLDSVPLSRPKDWKQKNANKKIKCSNGMVYDSIADAARKLGIKASVIYGICGGKTKTISGLSFAAVEENFPESRPHNKTLKRVFISDGREFTSAATAAEALGIKVDCLREKIINKRNIGGLFASYSNDFSFVVNRKTKKHKTKVIRSDGVVFGSMSAAGKELGVTHAAIRSVIIGESKSTCGFSFKIIED